MSRARIKIALQSNTTHNLDFRSRSCWIVPFSIRCVRHRGRLNAPLSMGERNAFEIANALLMCKIGCKHTSYIDRGTHQKKKRFDCWTKAAGVPLSDAYIWHGRWKCFEVVIRNAGSKLLDSTEKCFYPLLELNFDGLMLFHVRRIDVVLRHSCKWKAFSIFMR